MKVLVGCRVCRNCWGVHLEAFFYNSGDFLPGIGVACHDLGFCCGEALQGGFLDWCYGAPDAGPLNSHFCVQFFGETFQAHGALCRAL